MILSFYPEFDHLNLEELIDCFQKPLLEEEDELSLYCSELALLIKKQGDQGMAFLLDQIPKADTDRLVGILFALTETPLKDLRLSELLLTYLQDSRSMVVAEAIDGLSRLGEKDTVDRVLPLLEHPSPYVKGSVLRFMARLHPDRALPLLLQALKDPHFIVRENAADELGELDEVAAIPELHQLLVDSHPDVRQAAQTAIEILELIP
jgi:HEAT repeat protein